MKELHDEKEAAEASLATATERAEKAEVDNATLRAERVALCKTIAMGDCYARVLKECGIENDVIGYVRSLRSRLAGAAQELTLPDREGWWWEWDNEAKEWKHPQHVIHYSGPLCLEADFGNPAPGRWVQCVPPPQ